MWRYENSLYPYQRSAATRMVGYNTLLAYEMGTGKTPTTLWALEEIRESGAMPCGIGIIVVPASLKFQWKSEIEKFTDQDVVVIDGSRDKRKQQYLSIAYSRPGYMVMSYDSFVRDWEMIKAAGPYDFLVLDEATAIKSFNTKRSKHIKRVAFRFPIRFALTGTPIENGKLEELFSIMQFVNKEVLGKWPVFDEAFIVRNRMGWIERYRNVDVVHDRLRKSGMFARATHKQPEVAKYLPRVVERPTLRVPLSKSTAEIAKRISVSVLDDLDTFASRISALDPAAIDSEDWSHPDGRMMAKITVLRQFLSRPESIFGIDNPLVDDLRDSGILTPTPRADKMEALFDYLDDFLAADDRNKAVVFTSFIDTAGLIHAHYPKGAYINGQLAARQRNEQVERFKSDPQCRIFVSTDAGGYGLDLPQANLLVNYDLPWQPGLLAQRNARIKRASSEWEYVVIQNIVAEGTIEERILDMLHHKMALADAAVDGEGMDEHGRLTSDLDSLRSFLQDSLVDKV